MRLLLFGKTGQVARSFQEISGAGFELVVAGREDADLSVEGAVREAILSARPDVVVNAAAYTAVDQAEEEPDMAYRINAHAVEEMAGAAAETGAHLLHVSTDYVFDGNTDEEYAESDHTNPLNVYGQSKLAGEQAALNAHPGAVILRTSWVFSEFGANFVKTMLRLAKERDSLSVVDDQIGGPTSAKNIAEALMTICKAKTGGAAASGIFHFQGAPSASWADFATAIFKSAETPIAVQRITTKDYPTPAARPLKTVLDCSKINQAFGVEQPDWRESLNRVIRKLTAKEEIS